MGKHVVEQTLEIVLPVFALMAFGWFFARRNLISEAGVSGIVNFIFYLAIPSLLFRTLASGAVQEQIDPKLVVGYFSAALVAYGINWLISHFVFKNNAETSALGAMAGTFSNLVLIGLPLIQRAYGERGLIPLMLIVMLHSSILFTTTTLSLTLGRGEGVHWLVTLGKTLRSVLLNPIVIACLTGLLYGGLGLPLPKVASDTLALIGRAAAPTSLFAVGATLATCTIRGDLRESLTVSVLKLFMLPCLVFISTHYIFGVRPQWVTVAVIAASMPAGANVFVFARKYNVYVQRATAIVVLSTLGAVVTLTTLIAVLPAP